MVLFTKLNICEWILFIYTDGNGLSALIGLIRFYRRVQVVCVNMTDLSVQIGSGCLRRLGLKIWVVVF